MSFTILLGDGYRRRCWRRSGKLTGFCDVLRYGNGERMLCICILDLVAGVEDGSTFHGVLKVLDGVYDTEGLSRVSMNSPVVFFEGSQEIENAMHLKMSWLYLKIPRCRRAKLFASRFFSMTSQEPSTPTPHSPQSPSPQSIAQASHSHPFSFILKPEPRKSAKKKPTSPLPFHNAPKRTYHHLTRLKISKTPIRARNGASLLPTITLSTCGDLASLDLGLGRGVARHELGVELFG